MTGRRRKRRMTVGFSPGPFAESRFVLARCFIPLLEFHRSRLRLPGPLLRRDSVSPQWANASKIRTRSIETISHATTPTALASSRAMGRAAHLIGVRVIQSPDGECQCTFGEPVIPIITIYHNKGGVET